MIFWQVVNTDPDTSSESALTTLKVPNLNGTAYTSIGYVSGTVFGDAARAWLAGKIDDTAAVDRIAARFGELVEAWGRLRDPYTKERG